jgi:periplasmic copper chaperone A
MGPIRRCLVLVAVTVLAIGCGSSSAQPPTTVTAMTITNARTRPTSTGNTQAAIYLTMTSPVDDQLVDVTIDPSVAGAAELHQPMTDGGQEAAPMAGMDHSTDGANATMTPLTAIDVLANEPTALEPKSRHILLTDLVQPLVAGQRFTMTLNFVIASPIAVEVTVTSQV